MFRRSARSSPARSTRPRRGPSGRSGRRPRASGPGRSLRSTVSSTVPGITFRRSEAAIIVGESVNASSGSIVSAASGSSARSRSSTCRPAAARRARRRGSLRPRADRGLGLVGGELLDQRRRLHERVVGDPRHRGVAAAAVHDDPEGRAHLLRGGAEVEGAAAELDPLAAALVDRVVDPDRVGMVLAEPLEAVVVADLLVGGGDEDEVARRREAFARERGDRDGARRDLILHVERAAAPDVVVGEVAGPGIARPLGGVGDDGVGVGEEAERGAVAALDPGDEVRPLRHAGVELDLDAVRLQIVAQELGGDRLVARWVDGVQAQQLLQQPDRFVLKPRPVAQRRLPTTM